MGPWYGNATLIMQIINLFQFLLTLTTSSRPHESELPASVSTYKDGPHWFTQPIATSVPPPGRPCIAPLSSTMLLTPLILLDLLPFLRRPHKTLQSIVMTVGFDFIISFVIEKHGLDRLVWTLLPFHRFQVLFRFTEREWCVIVR
jgi:hypothetical protein